MRRIALRLAQEWLSACPASLTLKTDLFEEAVSPHHLLPDLGVQAIGMDCALAAAISAQHRIGAEHQRFVVGDLRRIPLRSGSIDQIFSGSSLDHFHDQGDIAVAIAELARVLKEGGCMVLVLDNPHNPVVRARNALPFSWLNRLGLVPYYVGATYRREEALRELEAAGLTVIEVAAVAHAPRLLAIRLVAVAERLAWVRCGPLLARVFEAFERLGRLPTRHWSGYYLAFRAEKRRTVFCCDRRSTTGPIIPD
jgi:SAM-dependent methyltransferase